ncbi:MAG: hypothetical protein HQP61_10290 [Peptococcaceae bacterium]|nr:hypothetical protein [Candidatus Syntrophopropionicum ammoniitolerans]
MAHRNVSSRWLAFQWAVASVLNMHHCTPTGVKAALKVIPHAGHLLSLERLGEANAAVKGFLDSVYSF